MISFDRTYRDLMVGGTKYAEVQLKILIDPHDNSEWNIDRAVLVEESEDGVYRSSTIIDYDLCVGVHPADMDNCRYRMKQVFGQIEMALRSQIGVWIGLQQEVIAAHRKSLEARDEK